MPFQCSICAEESTRICARCTKDACNNHLCEKCLRCSDCCECEVHLSEPAGMTVGSARSVFRSAAAVPKPEPELEALPEPPHPPPDPDPEPVPEDGAEPFVW
ncbi:conserved hypothetical protein [Candidatus Sulfopaludibacter sp. SbA4]|nr:conserved hypothetical protein [Candidatus Sulfopaludibacter sp. SbA4]